MELQLVDLTALLFSLSIILLCWVIMIRMYRKIQGINLERFDNSNSLRNSFVIGIGSGLVVFVLGIFSEHFSINKMDFSSLGNLAISAFAGLVNLVLQFSIVFALISWIVAFTFKDLLK